MANTVFYRDVKKNPNKITFKEILSDCRKKHSKRDFDYQLSAGSEFNSATEQDMLQKWQKPWVFYKLAIIGLIGMVLIFGFDALSKSLLGEGGFYPASATMAIIVPPMIVPLIITIFLWELNIPRNVALYEVFLAFMCGGVISLFSNLVIRMIGSDSLQQDPAYAGVFEEPAKLIAAVVLLAILFKKKKMYGLSGLLIGAAAGAGFGAFESVWYNLNYTLLSGNIEIAKFFLQSRFIGGFGMHTVWCAGYSAALALHTRNSKISAESFFNSDFLIMFVAAVFMHFINNWSEFWKLIGAVSDDGSSSEVIFIFGQIGLRIVEWIILLYIIRKCLYQVISIGRYQSGEGIGYTQAIGNLENNMAAVQMGAAAMNQNQASFAAPARITVVCMSGVLRGAVWQSAGTGDVLTIGRDDSNRFKIPPEVAGISRQHCIIRYSANGWTITDLNSSYGTSVNQIKLAPGIEQPLREGDVFYLGSNEQSFKISYNS